MKLTDEERRKRRLESKKKYRRSEKGKQKEKEYSQRDYVREKAKEYNQRPDVKHRMKTYHEQYTKEYIKTDAYKKSQERFKKTEKYKNYRKYYETTEQRKEYKSSLIALYVSCKYKHIDRYRKKRGSIPLIFATAEEFIQMHDSFHNRCAICEEELNGNKCIDHKVPISSGGEFDAQNLQVLCRTCNMLKGSLSMSDDLVKLILQEKKKLNPS